MPISIWRSVGNSYNAFVVESFIDELAHAANEDPLWYRYGRLQQHPRHQAVLEQLGQLSGWRSAINQGSQGLALFESFGTVVGQVADVSVDDRGVINVHKVTCVVDCGIAVNPDIVKQQMESAIIFGLTAALYGEINVDRGKVKQSNFHDYEMVRMNESPIIETHIINSGEKLGGAGEPGTPGIAPALANAIFDATGKRIRELPIKNFDLSDTDLESKDVA